MASDRLLPTLSNTWSARSTPVGTKIMVRTILLALDGSRDAEDALPGAAALASRTGARLLLVMPVPARAGLGLSPLDAGAERVARVAQARDYLQALAERAHARHPHLQTGAAPPLGLWPEAVLDEAALERVDLIIAATRVSGAGHTGVSVDPTARVGNAALTLSRRADVPVLFLPRGAAFERVMSTGGRLRVVIPLDGSPTAEAILPLVVRLGASLPILATVLHVLAAPGNPYKSLLSDTRSSPLAARSVARGQLSRATAAAYCRRVATWLEQHGVPARVEIRCGSVVEQIGVAVLERTDLLALGLPEALAWRFGYSVEQLLRTATVPVLLLRSTRAEYVVPDSGTASLAMTREREPALVA